jgi:hypothetical protein
LNRVEGVGGIPKPKPPVAQRAGGISAPTPTREPDIHRRGWYALDAAWNRTWMGKGVENSSPLEAKKNTNFETEKKSWKQKDGLRFDPEYCLNTAWILPEYCLNLAESLINLETGWILPEFPFWILSEYCLNLAWILAEYLLNLYSGSALATETPSKKCIFLGLANGNGSNLTMGPLGAFVTSLASIGPLWTIGFIIKLIPSGAIGTLLKSL